MFFRVKLTLDILLSPNTNASARSLIDPTEFGGHCNLQLSALKEGIVCMRMYIFLVLTILRTWDPVQCAFNPIPEPD